MKNNISTFVVELFCVVLFSLNMGISMGALPMLVDTGFNFLGYGIVLGSIVATILGPILYYTLVRNYLTVANLGILIGCCSLSGIIVTLILNSMVSSIVTPAVLVIGSVLIRIKESEKRDRELHEINKVGT